MFFLLLSAIAVLAGCAPVAGAAEAISLAGAWHVALDAEGKGEIQRWFAQVLPGALTMPLPGTTDQAGIGYALDTNTMTYPVEVLRVRWPGTEPVKRADEAGTLMRNPLFIGQAWYQREIDIPQNWRGRFIQLRLERVVWQSTVWLDEHLVGENDSLVAEHLYDLGFLDPGRHRITVRVDNGLIHNIGVIGHSYGPETQSQWNGVVGRMELLSTPPVFLRHLRITPAMDHHTVTVRASIHNAIERPVAAAIHWTITSESRRSRLGMADAQVALQPGNNEIDYTVPVTRGVEAWDEFNPTRYRLVGRVESESKGATFRHEMSDTFGFRQIARDGRHILVNGRRIFLRGTLDCCVYPRTGYPPVTVDEWLRVFGVIRQYGFNHVRFHTWCPPEAAFEAADRLGLYLAPETPFWVDDWTVTHMPTNPKPLGRDPAVLAWVRGEIRRISEAYGNHPSFALFCIGNEFGDQGTDWEQVNALLAEAKAFDNRRLYNASTARRRLAADDYWTTHATPKAAARGVGPAHTDWDFAEAAQSADLPVVAHETGQRPVFPNFDRLLPKFTGSLQPLNYERLRRRFMASGLADQMPAFERASAKFQILQYKAEHEGMARTPDFAGYQLLMLNDFTGQSEALVGILDPFWETKRVVTPAQVRQWNSPTVPLARFKRFTWTADEAFEAKLELAHFGPKDLQKATARWSLRWRDGGVVAQGKLGPFTAQTGALTPMGSIRAPLSSVTHASALTLSVSVAAATNEWTLWVYPSPSSEPEAGGVMMVHAFDDSAKKALAEGRRVLLLAHGLKNEFTAQTGFLSTYWSAGWWGNRFSALGLLCDPRHAALADFPNDGHSDWQWQELAQGATTFELADAPRGFRPIIQPVPDFHFNRLLAQVFEAHVGLGRLLVTGYDLEKNLAQRPAARQLRRSLLRYMNSDGFAPSTNLDPTLLDRWLAAPPLAPQLMDIGDRLVAAALDVQAAANLSQHNQDTPWSKGADRTVKTAAGYDWIIRAGSTWKDDAGSAWHGNPLRVSLKVPASVRGQLYLHAHDWNRLGRRGSIKVNHRLYYLGEHDSAGRWLVIEISSADTLDGTIDIQASPESGPNLMITRLAFVPAK